VLQYRESENPDTPADVTPETSTAVKLLKEELNINLIYDWIVNADQYSQKFGAELAAQICGELFDELDAPVTRVAALNSSVPFNGELEDAVFPNPDRIAEAAASLMRE